MEVVDLERTWVLVSFVVSAYRSSNRAAKPFVCPVSGASGAGSGPCPAKGKHGHAESIRTLSSKMIENHGKFRKDLDVFRLHAQNVFFSPHLHLLTFIASRTFCWNFGIDGSMRQKNFRVSSWSSFWCVLWGDMSWHHFYQSSVIDLFPKVTLVSFLDICGFDVCKCFLWGKIALGLLPIWLADLVRHFEELVGREWHGTPEACELVLNNWKVDPKDSQKGGERCQ